VETLDHRAAWIRAAGVFKEGVTSQKRFGERRKLGTHVSEVELGHEGLP
jgi:hypothetical protein